MSVWQRFVKLTDGDMETAAFGLLLGAFTLVASIGVVVYFASTGRLLVAAVTATALCSTVGICVRDYRRHRWSVVSALVVAVWALLTYATIAVDLWLQYGRG